MRSVAKGWSVIWLSHPRDTIFAHYIQMCELIQQINLDIYYSTKVHNVICSGKTGLTCF